ncbi:MAG: protein kinase [Phaeodactylibacter sp.]|nr:protein kinase [Phaeodactylibacter sp.]
MNQQPIFMLGLSPNDTFADRYRLRKRLGEGGFSESWLAQNDIMGAEQVVKVYRSLDEKGCIVFRREFAKAYHLMHPRLLRPTYFGTHQDRPYVVMPYCRRGAASRLAGKLEEREIARAMQDIAGALAYIHQPAYRIAHLDIKPENILLSEQGHYLLSDLGISGELRREFIRNAREQGLPVSGDENMPPPAYRAPETLGQEGNGNTGVASDIWALGATLYELASGYPPFSRPQTDSREHLSGLVPPELPPPFSWSLSNILKHCMDKDPAERPSAENLRQMAEQYLNSGQWPPRYFGAKTQSRRTGKLKSVKMPVRRSQLIGAVAAVALAIAGIAAWPVMKDKAASLFEKDNAPVAEQSLQEASGPREEPQPEDRSMANTLPQGQEGAPDAYPGSQAPPEIAPPVSPAGPPQPESGPPADGKIAERAVPENPKPEKKAEKPAAPKPEKPKAAKGSEKQQLEPRFNDFTKKWGYVDREGNWIIWPQFEEAMPFKQGKAKVAKKGTDGELDFYYLSSNGELTRVPEQDE